MISKSRKYKFIGIRKSENQFFGFNEILPILLFAILGGLKIGFFGPEFASVAGPDTAFVAAVVCGIKIQKLKNRNRKP